MTGLKFSDDGETLYVTDDAAGTIYAISAVSVPEPATALLTAAGLAILIVLRKKQ